VSGDFGAKYDTVVRWDRRLAREAPFFEQLFREHDVTSLADVGCGTAKHAILFASWNIEVWALDPNEEMLAAARDNVQESGLNVHLAQAGFGEVARTVGKVDAAVSLGNAFPHVSGIAGLREALSDFADAIRPGGPLVVHMLNHDRIEQQKLRFLPTVLRSDEEGETVVIKVIDHAEDHFTFEFVQLMRPMRPEGVSPEQPSEWVVQSHRGQHTKILGATMRAELDAAGFIDIQVFGNHSGGALDPDSDESAIWVATRR